MVPVRRHARHWRSYLAGGGLVLSALFLRKKRTDREHDDGNSHSAQKNGVDKELQAHGLAEPQIASAAKPNKKEKAKRTRQASERGESDARKFLFRLTVNEAITVLMTVASLVISYLTYRNAADTSQMRDAVNRLSQLAQDTKREADAAVESGRPYILVTNVQNIKSLRDWQHKEGILGLSLTIANYGHAPAITTKAVCFNILTNHPPTGVEVQTQWPRRFFDGSTDLTTQVLIAGGPERSFNCPGAIVSDVEDSEAMFAKNTPYMTSEEYHILAVASDYFWLVGYVDYTDVSGTSHRTTFCMTVNDFNYRAGGSGDCNTNS